MFASISRNPNPTEYSVHDKGNNFFFKAHFFLFDMQSRFSAVHLFESFAKQLLFPAFPKISMSEELLVSRGTVVTKKQYFSINFRFEMATFRDL